MPARWKISSDTRSGASARIGGFDNCQPSAPGVGTNPDPSGSAWPCRAPTSRRSAAASAARVALVHEAAGDRAGAGVEVFVAAPDGEVGSRCRAGCSGMLPTACARSKPTTQPLRVRELGDRACRSNAWPVRYCTPGSSTSAMREPCSSSARSIAASEIVPFGFVAVAARSARSPDRSRGSGSAIRPRSDRRETRFFSIRIAGRSARRPVEAHHHQVQIRRSANSSPRLRRAARRRARRDASRTNSW